ncbi:16S rRNA (cytosine(1402)-N(4))-methyltransferase RsmH [Ekhidna sp. To15]|uniref:16S rRNA (cytosine(1402)-N(4))-methyltransferase RsmH n=1 Tax=Ekhidna sp. To15 TaxID=3395267 RepID=UPI003F5266FF
MSEYHNPVMLKECMEGLDIKPDGVYVDVTFGGGGHSKAILEQLSTGHLIAFDQDADAEKNAQALDTSGKRSFTFIESNFRFLKKYLKLHGITEVDGILADLGVSSHQFDEPARGFTIRAEGVLDMRMDQAATKSAREVVNEYDEKDLIHILSAYGEIRNARTLAREIVNFRMNLPIETNEQLKAIAMKNAPKGRDLKYLAQVFQAIRIEVNEELEALKEFLVQAGEVLKADGRLVVMSYHSLEDRPVKNFINKGNIKGVDEKDFYGNPIRVLDPVNRKPIVPEAAEIKENSRARSAKLRIGRKK